MKLILFLALVVTLSACGQTDRKTTNSEITVSAAVSLKDAFTEIGRQFSEETGATISFNFGASGILQRQIEAGAPVDIFASAGEPQMNALAEKGLIDTNTRANFASNSLVLIVPSGSTLDAASFDDLKREDIKKIAVGNPKTVPAGQYTQQVFDSFNLSNVLKPKLVFAENVRQVLEYVIRGEVDTGIVYSTDAAIVGGQVMVVAVAPETSHKPSVYPIAVVKDSKDPAALTFITFVTSKNGQEILQKYGFIAPAK